ncbi:hypothetical protein L596_025363 [Steinernema carpocapsae]|uniref:Uncharacterized protein n=1 Tax=Steinernema carpocapsae TaxID=34508 RepID=A0A4U5M7J8_STECR|nr:hypothetical protein L596_025363 [Steinernema carpocapsae]
MRSSGSHDLPRFQSKPGVIASGRRGRSGVFSCSLLNKTGNQSLNWRNWKKDFENRLGWAVLVFLKKMENDDEEMVMEPESNKPRSQTHPSRHGENYTSEI